MQEYPDDRMDIPEFFVTLKNRSCSYPAGTVLAPTATSDFEGWLVLGAVSKQTPFGQGLFSGYELTEVRKAEPNEVLAALRKRHPYGRWFRPSNRDAIDIRFNLVFSTVIGNWTADTPRDGYSVLNVTKDQLVKAAEKADRKYQKMMWVWWWITYKQRRAIRKAFGV